jgi:pimeloyl-ACP methyl ester carboxylesterase
MNIETRARQQISRGRFRIPEDGGEVAGVELDYTIAGKGDPVVFLHGGILTSWFEPLMAEPVLADLYQLISYHRPGYGTSSLPAEPLTVAGQAACCLALMRHLGLAKAHLVGHSIGGCIALQAALDAPDAVASLALLEPPVMAAVTDPSLASARKLILVAASDS